MENRRSKLIKGSAIVAIHSSGSLASLEKSSTVNAFIVCRHHHVEEMMLRNCNLSSNNWTLNARVSKRVVINH